jgi:Zn-dependent metalloprotease
MAARKSAARSKGRGRARPRSRSAQPKRVAVRNNGLRAFALHATDEAGAKTLSALRAERPTLPAFAVPEAAAPEGLDPETVAQLYLQQALESDKVPRFTTRTPKGRTCEFKSLGVETLPLTGTRTVKFRQTCDEIPVYGSLVTVELGDNNECLAINSALGEPYGVSPIARISPAEALKTAAKAAGYKGKPPLATPRLFYYFDRKLQRWRLTYFVEDVAVTKPKREAAPSLAPLVMDYVVDAHTGKLVAQMPRTPSLLQTIEGTGTDELGQERTIGYVVEGGKKVLRDEQLNIHTHDFQFRDPELQDSKLPGVYVTDPPGWSKGAVSAHANAGVVAHFLRDVVRRNNIDNRGGAMISSINCLVKSQSPGQKQWFNAFWNSRQMVYGQVLNNGVLRSLAASLDVVGHEMFHGVTENTARLEYAAETGALNESYSDIFGALISNFVEPDIGKWNWEVGEGLSDSRQAFRDMSDPSKYGQPAHMRDFKVMPVTQDGDWGGVHVNSGIHNFAAYRVMTAKGAGGAYLFTPTENAAMFYICLTQHLSRTSIFADSRRGVLLAARTLFRNESQAARDGKIVAIEAGFTAAGIV